MIKHYSHLSAPSRKSSSMDILDIILYIVAFLLIFKIISYLFFSEKYLDGYDKYHDPKLEEIRQRLSATFPEIKNVDLAGSNKSFTINKQHMYICTKDENGQYYDDNMLTYVILHELAHVLCDEVGHTEKYKQIFRSLLERGHQAGLYDPSKPPIDNYCNY